MEYSKEQLQQQFPIVLTQPLIWGDMDAYDHINNTVYFRYFEDARIAYFEKIGVNEHKRETNLGPILASTSCNFRLPLQYPDQIHIVATIEDLKEKRFTMKYKVYSQSHDALAAEGEGLVVFYDYNQQKSCPIPEAIVERIQALSDAG
ncbi:MAG: acyl-CoA thioesterase [Pseudomonadales bacterium]|nr:acyl-CoA thioesterase [Pseudomonadales bacterium]